MALKFGYFLDNFENNSKYDQIWLKNNLENSYFLKDFQLSLRKKLFL